MDRVGQQDRRDGDHREEPTEQAGKVLTEEVGERTDTDEREQHDELGCDGEEEQAVAAHATMLAAIGKLFAA